MNVAARLQLLAIVTALLGTAAPSAAHEDSARADRIGYALRELASPEYDGRLTGSTGNLAAAERMAAHLEELGFEPLPGQESLLHWYRQPVVEMGATPQLRIEYADDSSQMLSPGIDFTVEIRETTRFSGAIQAPIVELTPPRANPSWIAENRDAAIVVTAAQLDHLSRNAEVMGALFHPTRGPAALLIAVPDEVSALPRNLFLTADRYSNRGPMLVQVTAEAAARLRDESARRVVIEASHRVTTARVANVAGMLVPITPEEDTAPEDGRDAWELDTFGQAGPDGRPPVVVSAHFDGPGRLVSEWHYPGAIDNASGVAVVLEVARSLAETATRERPVWVVLFNGEEQGLRGSAAFASEYRDILDRGDGSRVVNVDTVGHSRDVPFTISTTAGSLPLGLRVDHALEQERLRTHRRTMGGSDHDSFGGAGFRRAQALSIVQTPYRQMHTRDDEPANAELDVLASVAEAVLTVATDLAGAD
ncbi:MAG: M28 family peptidase [Spirochaetota bacterium]